MKSRFPLLTLIMAFLISCSSNETIQRKENSSIGIVRSDSIANCNCLDGIGSRKENTPIIGFVFSNGKVLTVCGFVDKEMEGITVSEFNVFECTTGNSLAEYDATKICRLFEKNDTLEINEFRYLPIGENYEWELIKIGKQIITLKSDEIVVSEIEPDVERFDIDSRKVEKFLGSIEKGKGIDENWEKEIGYLEALSIFGNEKAWNILKNYETYIGQKTDGAIAETWKDAVATVSWIKK